MSERKSSHRVFTREFKVWVVQRMLAGEDVAPLARELRLFRKDLYVWRDRFLAGGPEALRGRGRPPQERSAARAGPPPCSEPLTAELEAARKRICELERKIGQQQLELDFFRQALRQVRGGRQLSAVAGETGSIG
jgi:transposase-like protein